MTLRFATLNELEAHLSRMGHRQLTPAWWRTTDGRKLLVMRDAKGWHAGAL